MTWPVMALKHLSKHQAVWDTPIHDIVIIVVMLEYGVTALIVQVSAIVILRCVSSEEDTDNIHYKAQTFQQTVIIWDIDSIH